MTNRMKRFLCMLLAVLMVLSTPVSVFAENSTNTTEQTKEVSITEALADAKAGETITLSADTEASVVVVPENVTLDLNGYKLKADYMACYGVLVDQSESNNGLLAANANRFYIREDNAQLPVKTNEGYKFFEVTKFNKKFKDAESKYIFQPFVEEGAHEFLKKGAEASGVTINVRLSWNAGNSGKRSQDFVYSDEFVKNFFDSYVSSTGKYSRQLALTLKGAENFKDLSFTAVVAGANVVKCAEPIVINKTEEDVPADNNQLTEEMTIDNGKASAVVSMGTELEAGAKELTLTTEEMDATTSNIQLGDGEQMLSMDVHVNGVSKDNTVPVIITIDEIAPEFLNQGNIKLYHVENDETVEMTRVYSLEEVDAHNEYYYDILTGTITMALASFSEVAVVADTDNAWEGNYDYSWYTNAVAPIAEGEPDYVIANADQLAAFGAIVGGMAKDEKGIDIVKQDDFEKKTVKLLSDINLGDAEKENNPDIIFYPIGYYNSTGSYEKVSGGSVTSSVSSFEGTFDGNGHTISNFYQNTWEMFGDYNDGYSGTPNHYKDAMGLFGYVVNGTVKNLTVNNFSSDGEFTPTGVIAAYAVNSTFENIAITNCNPRVYNTGNGGIIGIAGDTSVANDDHITLKNITVDNSNKISALWGSWDVACGGLVGMYRGNVDASGNATEDTISFENCHVSAIIDVYNDVCANYQYYAYRYSGMIIGSVRHNTTNAEGKTIPNMTGISATGCTVNYGDWNDYYYCEFEKNSMASYSEDYQFSRVPHSELNFTDTNGNGVVDADERASVTGCKHTHTAEENNQAIYLPFHQLFTGYSWGVSSIGLKKYSGIVTNLDIIEGEQQESVVKFKDIASKKSFETEKTITIGELFGKKEDAKVGIDVDNVQVAISPVGESSTAGGTYTANTTDWTQGTLTFSGSGLATVTITDYYFCTPTTITVDITPKTAVQKFATKFTGDFLYRVGTEGDVALGTLFELADGIEASDVGTVSVTIEGVNGTGGFGKYKENETWANGTIDFTNTGVVKVTIADDKHCIPTELYLEVVDAKNITKAESATANNVVLLNNITGGFSVSTGYGFYGNGFTVTLDPNSHSTRKGNGYAGYIHMNGGTIDNVKIDGPVFAESNIYQSQALHNGNGADDPASYFRNGICIDSGDAEIINSYVSGARVPVLIKAGNNVRIENTHISGGAYANIEVLATKSLTLKNVITEQKVVKDSYGNNKDVIGLGVVINAADVKLILEGLTQYNWITKNQWSGMLGNYEGSFPALFTNDKYGNHRFTHPNGATVVNTGIIYACDIDDATFKSNTTGEVSGYTSIGVTAGGKQGIVYTRTNNNSGEKLQENEVNAPSYKADTQKAVPPTTTFDFTVNNAPETSNSNDYCYYSETAAKYLISFDQGDSKDWYYDILEVKKGDKYITCSVSVSDGAVINNSNKKITFNAAGDYTVTYTYTDANNYKIVDGKITSYETTYTKEMPVTVFAVEPEADPTTFVFGNDGYKTVVAGNETYVMPNVSAIKEPKANNNGVLQEAGIKSKVIGGETIYYPVIAQHKIGKSTGYYNYFSVFEAVTIKDADGSTEYNLNTTAMPDNLKVIGGFIDNGAESANGTAIFNYSTGKTIKIKTVSSSSKNYGLCYYPDSSFSSGTTARPVQTIVVKYQYTDTNGKIYHYYIGYLCAQGNNGREDEASSGSGCVTPDTLITLANGSKVRVDSLTGNEELLVWNLETGTLDSAPIMFVDCDPETEIEVVQLYFSDGTDVKVIYEHGFWDYDLNKYVYLDRYAEKYIGHEFAKQDGDKLSRVTLTDVVLEKEVITAWSPVTENHLCYFVNGMLSMPGGVGGLFNIFDVDAETMTYDFEAMANDIETYGLFTYEELNSIEPLSEDMFNAAGGAYLKVSIGKGNMTMDDLVYMIQRYSKYFD